VRACVYVYTHTHTHYTCTCETCGRELGSVCSAVLSPERCGCALNRMTSIIASCSDFRWASLAASSDVADPSELRNVGTCEVSTVALRVSTLRVGDLPRGGGWDGSLSSGAAKRVSACRVLPASITHSSETSVRVSVEPKSEVALFKCRRVSRSVLRSMFCVFKASLKSQMRFRRSTVLERGSAQVA